jgi:predicted O-linked N-acetylglucosamine transferase (SPINDLY family)
MIPIADLRALADRCTDLGDFSQAEQLYRQALEQQPDESELWAGLGRACHALGKSDEAVTCYERAAELEPGDPEPLGELGLLYMQRGELAEAVACYERVLRRWPDSAGAYNNLGLALMGQGRLEAARATFEQALFLRPELAEVHNNLGLALLNLGWVDEALARFEQAIRLRPDYADAANNLGLALDAQGNLDDALDCFEQAVTINPDHHGALTNRGNAYRDQGCMAEAITSYRKALAVRPDAAQVHSNLLLAMHYQSGADPGEILAEARHYAQQHAAPLAGTIERHAIRPLDGRRLRVGYVSADLREHPVAYFLEPILAAHDHHHWEILCYADVPRPDAVTERLQGYADHWRSLVGLSDAQSAEIIRSDSIDILVDLAGHTAGNRLLAFARKPAPIQASYLGYLGTTGLPAIDYYLTDAQADPPGLTDSDYQERLVRLPACAFCYSPGPAPEVSPEPPARQSGRITFGCLNHLAKVSGESLALWSKILSAVAGSRLQLRNGASHSAQERIRATLARHGVSPERLLFAGRTARRWDYLELYHAVDIALDPIPYNGVTTTCDTLWMGVPVISLAGQMSVSRQGVRFLRSVGLDALIAETPHDYVRIAAALASDPPRLAALRSSLRERVSRSPLVDAHRLARDLEAAYRGMWDQR